MGYNITKFIYFGFFGMLMLMVAVTSFSLRELQGIVGTLEAIVDNHMSTIDRLRAVQDVHDRQAVFVDEVLGLIGGEIDSMDERLITEIEASQKSYARLYFQTTTDLQATKRHINNLNEQFSAQEVVDGNLRLLKEIETIEKNLNQYNVRTSELYRVLVRGKWVNGDAKLNALYTEVNSLKRAYRSSIEDALSIVENLIQVETQKTETNATQAKQKIIILAGGSILLSLVFAFFLGKKSSSMTRSIQRQINTKDSLSELTETMRDEQTLESMLDKVLIFLANKTRVKVQAFYILKDEGLELTASYAFTDRKTLSNVYRLGEGIVGQCAKERKMIRITDVPSDYIRISSGIGHANPKEISCFPIVYEDKLLGVLEIGMFSVMESQDKSLLEESVSIIGIAIHSVMASQAQRRLLATTQKSEELIKKQNEDLTFQQEELRSVNENLKEKTLQLSRSEEELKQQSEELKATNEELEEKQSSIRKQADELEMKAKELERASQYKSEFLANMSHELRTPLNSMLILSKDFADNKNGNLTETQQQDAKFIYEGGRDLLNLINDILDLSKVEAGRLDIRMESVELSHITRGVEAMFKRQTDEKGIQLLISTHESLPKAIRTDSQRLEQILKNLLSNAIKFTSQGSVSLNIYRPDSSVKFQNSDRTADNTIAFSIVDTGIGIPADKQKTIFEAFRQQDGSTSRKYGGTGLGLTISRELARLLNGEIHLESKENVGSTFTLFLSGTDVGQNGPQSSTDQSVQTSAMIESAPQGTPSQSQPEDATRVADQVQQNNGTSKSLPMTDALMWLPDDRRITDVNDRSLLIIEDDRDFSEIIGRLARQKGFKVLSANLGRDGLLLADQFQPTGILLDLGLPDIDGKQVLEQLKYNLNTRNIPVHIISGREQDQLLLAQGAVSFMHKPIQESDLQMAFTEIDDYQKTENRHILVIEDDRGTQQSIERLLESPQITITCASTQQEAWDLLGEHHFDCITLDLGLPDLSGAELVKKIHSHPNAERTPIVIYTGREISEEENRILDELSSSVVIKGAESPERLIDDISLFLHQVSHSFADSQRETIERLHNENAMLQGKRVLLVDDDLRNVYALTGKLKEVGLDVTMTKNGKLAVEKIETEGLVEGQQYDIILMDIMMPVMDGYEAMQLIRQVPQYKDTPILALTAKAMPGDRQKCIDAGASDYVTKPIDVDKLFSMLRVWLYDKVA